MSTGLLAWLLGPRAPADWTPGRRHAHAIGTATYLVAVVVHFGLLWTFAAFGVWPLAWFNVGSVTAWAMVGWLHRRHKTRTAAALAVTEGLAHAVFATWVLGWTPGFHLFAGLVGVLNLGFDRGARWIGAAGIVVWIALYVLLSDRLPMVPLAPSTVSVFAFGSYLVAFLLVAVSFASLIQAVDTAETTLARERARSESLLRAEVSHQVAARSRELGQMLAKIDASFVVGKLSVGDRFDTRYRVQRELGAGGMGAVYEVERDTDQQRLALKIVTGEVSGASAARFAREAEIGAGVHHRNVISIVDVGIAGGVPFLAMELAPKGSLEERRERFGDATWALPILREIAAGLAALHDAGVVHRDLKPANVLFVEGDVAKISDFGISRFGELDTGPQVDANAPTLGATPPAKPQGLTATGMLLGTPYYMAPEAARGGRTVDAPADVFAFGILACEMLSGRAPFANPPVFLAMSGQPLPPVTFAESVPEWLRSMLLACLAEQPATRPTMRSVGEALANEVGAPSG